MRAWIAGSLLAATAAAALSSDTPGDGQEERIRALEARHSAARERARLVGEKSIFRKERSRKRRDRDERTREIPRPPPPEEEWVLTGVVGRDSGATAIIEEARGSRILRKLVGESVADGKVKSIGFDYVEYENASGTTKVVVGCDLTGRKPNRSGGPSRSTGYSGASSGSERPGASTAGSTSPAVSTSEPAAPPGEGAPGGATESIEERMRRRRMEEEGKK